MFTGSCEEMVIGYAELKETQEGNFDCFFAFSFFLYEDNGCGRIHRVQQLDPPCSCNIGNRPTFQQLFLLGMVAMTHEIVQIDEDYKNLKDFK